MGYAIVFLGAGIGGAPRHGVNKLAVHLFGMAFPFGTMAVNIAGCFLIGCVAEYWAIKSDLPQHVRLFLTTGVLGGFTTFSAFSLDAALLWERGQTGAALAYVVTSVVLSLAAIFLGLTLVRMLIGGAGS